MKLSKKQDFFFFHCIISPCNASVLMSTRPTPSHFTKHTPRLPFYISTSHLKGTICPLPPLQLAICTSSHAEKVTVCVCECLPVFTFVLRLFHCSIWAQRAQRGIYLNLCTASLISHSPSSLSFSLFCLFSFCLCNTLNPCSTNYSWNRNGNTQRT